MQQISGDVGQLELEDLVAARAWLVGNDVAFPDQILVVGESYGGFLALYAFGREPKLWAAAIVEAAVGDWSLTYRDASPMLPAALRTWFRGTPDERAELYRDRSPVTWANRVSAPIYAIQGRNDTRTAPAQMATYIERLEQLDKPVVVDWLDAGHAGAGPAQDVHFMRRRLDFARAVLDAGG
jgi:dipeptidyl aminopeptidase/acylaminoacyl peptidase